MPTLFELSKPENQARFHRELAEQFPDALYGSRRDFSAKLAGEFDAALATGSEEAMQNIIETHPYLLQYAFRTTGHHSSEERRVGTECVSTCRSRRSPNH